MALLKFTESDRLASIVIPTEWYHLEVTEIDGPKESTSKKSFNFFFKVQVSDGPYAGKELSICFNTGTKSPSVLGTQQFFPTAWMLQLAAAIQNKKLDEVSLEMDTEELIRKPFDGKIEKGIHEGVPMNTLLTFLPAGTGKDATAPF